MNKYDRSKQFQQLNRASEIDVSDDFVKRQEELNQAAFVSGNSEMFALGMNTLAKIKAQSDLSKGMEIMANQNAATTTVLERLLAKLEEQDGK
tara:strand:+ start:253 stop:531 length:279 start_codon:yes stop_codon:yes gene_type:complete